MREFVTGTDHLHAQILIGTHRMTRTQAPYIEHDLLALQARLELVDNRLHHRLVLGDHALGPLLDRVVEMRGDQTEAFGNFGRAEEVVFDPGNAVLLFHVPRDIVHRAIAVQQVEFDLRRVFDFGDSAIT